jgi:ubiquinone/menaquinone biosynthesis C-methylase UbiE
MIRKFLPYPLYKRLFGDRRKYYCNFDKDDQDWLSWIDNITTTYEHRDKSLIDKFIKLNAYKIIQNSLINFHNKDIIEIGPGFLDHEKFWKNKTPKSFDLIDSNLDFLKISEKKLNKRNIKVKKFIINEVKDMSQISSGSYDYVLSFFSLEHIMNLEEFVVQINRILKKDGYLIFVIPNEGHLAWGLGRFFFTRRYVYKKLGLDYDKIICWEHPNFSDKILKCLDYSLKKIKVIKVPNLFFLDFSISIKGIYKKKS